MDASIPDSRVDQYLLTEKSVTQWIEQVLNKKLPEPNDLHTSLKDGILLCQLMMEIDHSSIPHIQCNTNHAFRLKENISFFLLACEDFKVPNYKLFTVNDLWEDQSIVAVVECLEELAHITHARGYPLDLPQISLEPDSKPPSTLISAEKKALLKTLIAKQKIPTLKSKPKRTAGITLIQLEYLARVNGINMDKIIKSISRMQAVVRGRRVRANIKKYARNQAFRKKVICEILSTEQSYLNGLKLCVKLYLQPLSEMEKPLISEEQKEGIFNNVVEIIDFNNQFANLLKPRVDNYFPNQRIGDIFLETMDVTKVLDVYTPYVQNFDFSVALMSYLTVKNQPFQKFLSECRERPESAGLDLSSLLITPIQRIPRYNLLLRDLIKYTQNDPDHPDLPDLEAALVKMEQTGKEINKRKGDSEGILKVAFLASTIGKFPPAFNLLIPNRRLVAHALHANGKEAVYLFTDLFLFVRSKKPLVPADVAPSCNLLQPPTKNSSASANQEEVLSYASSFLFPEIESYSASPKLLEISLNQGKKAVVKFAFETQVAYDEWVSLVGKYVTAKEGKVELTTSKSDSDTSRRRSTTTSSSVKGNNLRLPGMKSAMNSPTDMRSVGSLDDEDVVIVKKKKWLSLKGKSKTVSRQHLSQSMFDSELNNNHQTTSMESPTTNNSIQSSVSSVSLPTTSPITIQGSPSKEEFPKKIQRKDSRTFRNIFLGTSAKKNPNEIVLSAPSNFRHMNLKLNKEENLLFVDESKPLKEEKDLPHETSSLPTIQSCINLTSL
eukprot:TRINITY_DN17567_c0_g1_i1.p1 TRINITY_DN17567_c0_g1~~TRINITY_DN17567_c0_g1_i1.p1  ORF type:complete len:779 (+),score=170.94 TRINITY_DN17567_c0_g1_i1:108-2444(+)